MIKVDYKMIAKTVWNETMVRPNSGHSVDDLLFVFENDCMHCTTLYVAPKKSDNSSNKKSEREKTLDKLVRRKKDAPLAVAIVSSMQIKPKEYSWYVQIYAGKSVEYCVSRNIDETSGSLKYGSYQLFPDGFFGFMDKIGSKVKYAAVRLSNGDLDIKVADKGITYADALNILNVGESLILH